MYIKYQYCTPERRTVMSRFIIATIMLLWGGIASAQEGYGYSIPVPDSYNLDRAPFGAYGHRHKELHQGEPHSVIDTLRERLAERTGYKPSCCDDRGECRVTRIRYNTERQIWQFNHNNTWCPVYSYIVRDIDLGKDVEAVVCAPFTEPSAGACPGNTWCAAQTFNGG